MDRLTLLLINDEPENAEALQEALQPFNSIELSSRDRIIDFTDEIEVEIILITYFNVDDDLELLQKLIYQFPGASILCHTESPDS